MGEWDYYCALCGGPLYMPYGDPDEEDENSYDPDIVRPDDPRMQWTANVRVIMSRPDEYGAGKEPWISGPASTGSWGNIDVKFPEDEPAMANREIAVKVYEEDEHGGFTVPFHADCQSLLKTYIGTEELDTHVLSETFKALGGENSPHGLNDRCLSTVDYGEIGQEAMGQFWLARRDEEYFVMSPTNIPELQAYYASMPRLHSDAAAVHSSARSQPLVHPDPFSSFPLEIISNVLLSLPPRSLLNLLLASRVAHNAMETLGNHFWKSKILHEMSYLYDLPTAPLNNDEDPIDWRRVYGDMRRAIRPTSKQAIHGLANRRRIWKYILPQIADPYTQRLRVRQERKDGGWPSALLDAQSTEMVPLAQPQQATSMTPLTWDLSQVAHVGIALLVSLDERGEICGLSVDGLASSLARLAADDDPLQRAIQTENVPVPDNDWLTGFIVTSSADAVLSGAGTVPRRRRIIGVQVLFAKGQPRQIGLGQGDQCLVHVPPGCFLVGLRTHLSAHGTLCKIDLFHLEEWKAGPGSERVSDAHAQSYNLEGAKHVWRGQLASPRLPISDISYYSQPVTSSSSTGPDRVDQIMPLEALVFGESEDELADVTELLADTRFGGFQVRYGSRPARAIGPCHKAMKSLKIDGKGGERILHFLTTRGSRLDGMRFVTSHDRQLVVGEPGPRNTEQGSGPRCWPTGRYPPLAAIYCAWPRRGTAEELWLGAVGHANAHHFGRGVKFDDFPLMSRRIDGLCWEPIALPESLVGFGPVLGQERLQPQNEEPGDEEEEGEGKSGSCGVVSWVDGRHELNRIRVTLGRDPASAGVPIVAITCQYGNLNTEEACVGPTIFSPPPSQLGEESTESQYVQSEWEVGGRKLQVVKVWTSRETDAITAIQFVAEGERTSPRWGLQSHDVEKTDNYAEIRFLAGGGDAVGLKVFMGYPDVNRTFEPVVRAVQGVRMAN